MKESKSVTKDPICGMTMDEATTLHAELDGKTFYFCSDFCRQKFLSTPTVPSWRKSLEAVVDKNVANAGVISANAGRVAVRVIHLDEELMITRSGWRVERTTIERKAWPRAGLTIEGGTA